MTKYEFEKEVIFLRNQYSEYRKDTLSSVPTNEFDIINMIYEALLDLIKENKEIVKSLSSQFKQSLKFLFANVKNEMHNDQTSMYSVHRAIIADRLAEEVEDILVY